ncbi:unnamed protein product [Amoebophrya sp. A25]|nr:unnamed protein product [Amoebophrya sp. A25]|eukprot:GSA25T00015266001.1
MITSSRGFDLQVGSDTDYIHDVAFNYFGTRVAFCTSRQKISIWEKKAVADSFPREAATPSTAQTGGSFAALSKSFGGPAGLGAGPGSSILSHSAADDTQLEWKEIATIDCAHSGPIWRLDWANPEFGPGVFVSCGEDRAVNVWSERTYGERSGWKKRASRLDATKAVVDVRFAPRHHGLKMASASLDGFVRVYEAPDALNLGDWLTEDYCISNSREGVQALSWSPDIYAEYIAAVGTDGKVYIHTKNVRKWEQLHSERHHAEPGSVKDVQFSPNLCRPYDLLVTCGRDAKLWRFDTGPEQTKLTVLRVLCEGPDLIWRGNWNMTGTMLTLSPESGDIQVWTVNARGEWASSYEIRHKDESVSIKQSASVLA